ncbi:MAG TPA: ferritin family protein [Anaerolineales bacterium]
MELQKIFEYALQREFEGKRFFEENASRLSHAAAAGAFRNLAAEEQKHIEFIQGQLAAIQRGEALSAEAGVAMEQAGFFSQRAASEMIDQTVAEAMVPDLPVLRMAFLIERDFSEFYEQAAQNTEGEAKRAFTLLAVWERGHERLFKMFHDLAFEAYARMPWGG